MRRIFDCDPNAMPAEFNGFKRRAQPLPLPPLEPPPAALQGCYIITFALDPERAAQSELMADERSFSFVVDLKAGAIVDWDDLGDDATAVRIPLQHLPRTRAMRGAYAISSGAGVPWIMRQGEDNEDYFDEVKPTAELRAADSWFDAGAVFALAKTVVAHVNP
jgi:hypothetical protein